MTSERKVVVITYNAIRSAKRVGDIARFGMPCSVRRAFDKLDRFPRGLVPLGDSVCRFPPTQGQGMSVAAQECCVLASLLESRRGAFKGLLPCARFSLARTAVSGQGEKDAASTRVSRKRPGTSRRAEGSALSTLSLRFRCRRPRPRCFRSRVQYTSGSAVQARSFSANCVAGSTLEKSPS